MMNFTKNVNWAIQTGGDGLWSSRSTIVEVTQISINWVGDGVVEVNLTFDPNTWNTERDGLIYTDQCFLIGAHEKIAKLLPGVSFALDYTEEGMQGDDYVSLESHDISPYENVFAAISPEEIIAEMEKHYEEIMIEAGAEPFNGRYHE
ncbi:MAG: hypothetical protein RBS24_07060 [Bacilli bacterium]|nr:hypothetical protein [Bacilli bacterium]